MSKADILVTVVAILRDHAAILPAFVDEVFRLLEARYANFEIVLVDNGSQDDSPAVVRKLLEKYKCLRLLRLSRRMDDDTAVIAGLDAAIGDFVVTLDPDSDPPEEIPAMVERCRAGSDAVLGIDTTTRPAGPFYRLLRNVYFGLSRWLVGIELIPGATRFRVLSRNAVNALTRVRYHRQHFAVIAAEIGLETVPHPYHRRSRTGRRAETHLFRALRMGLSVIVHHSIAPLRLVSVLGILGSLASLAYSVYVIVIYLIKQDVMPGWTTLSLQVSGLFLLVFVMLTLMGEYLGRLLMETSSRPNYHVREEQSSAVMLADPTRPNVHARSAESDPETPQGR